MTFTYGLGEIAYLGGKEHEGVVTCRADHARVFRAGRAEGEGLAVEDRNAGVAVPLMHLLRPGEACRQFFQTGRWAGLGGEAHIQDPCWDASYLAELVVGAVLEGGAGGAHLRALVAHCLALAAEEAGGNDEGHGFPWVVCGKRISRG